MPLRKRQWISSHGQDRYLVQGRLPATGRAYLIEVALCLEGGGEAAPVSVLVSRRGYVQELVVLAPGQRAAGLRILAADDLPSPGLFLRRLGALEYRGRQFWRILRVLSKQPRERRARLGITLRALHADFDYLYDTACRLRANIYTRSYGDWHAEFYGLSPKDQRKMHRRMRRWHSAPHFHILLLTGQDTPASSIEATRRSLQAQVYGGHQCTAVSWENWPCALPDISRVADPANTWVILLHAGTQLAASALYWFAHVAHEPSGPGLIYADHDRIDLTGNLSDPVFKPDWSPELLKSTNYIGPAFAWRATIPVGEWALHQELAAGYSPAAWHSLVLAISSQCNGVAHVPAPLWHLPVPTDPADPVGDEGAAAATGRVVAAHLGRQGGACVEPQTAERCRIRYALGSPQPLVSIVIPTRDGLSYLRKCVESLLDRTTYSPYEIIVMDNQSVQRETLDYFGLISRNPCVRILPFDAPFNYSRINNYAVAQARGQLICLLNNDTEVISPDWLDEMASLLLSQPDIGVVGAKLLFGDGTVQHAGDTVGPGGCADHLHVGLACDDPGYAGRAQVVQELSAVTAACLVTHTSLYRQLGGLNERDLPVAFNDVDFCLRVRETGHRVLWTPHALLYHHESVSRGKDLTPAQADRARREVRYMRSRWGHVMAHDPYYNPNLNYQQPDFSLSATPFVARPW